MADKSVGELIAAQSVTPTDLFVLEQNGTAKKLTGQILENWLVSFADGHGGIQSIAKLSTSGLVDTYRITLADTTTFDFMVTNGKSIKSISKASTSGLVDTYRITFNDSTSSTFTVTNGAKGDKGDTAYIWIKYASQDPTVNSNSFGDVPDDWIGVYFGFSSSAPTDWKQYKWYRIKGEKGDTGDPASLVRSSVNYQVGDSGTIIPSGSWSESIPPVPQGKYLWTKEVTQFNTGNPITKYSVSRFGIDGTGSVSTVADISPDANGNVPLSAADVKALPVAGGTMKGAINMNGQPIKGLNDPTKDDEAANKGYVDLKAYPVGAIYQSSDSTSPASIFGGTWEQLKDKFLLGAGNSYSAGSTGGEANHSLTLNEMPAHNHRTTDTGGAGNVYFSDGGKSVWLQSSTFPATYTDYTSSAGGSQGHNNMPPYLAVYMWKRVA